MHAAGKRLLEVLVVAVEGRAPPMLVDRHRIVAAKAVLITGCSTGIGRATAEHLADRGWTVYATARRPESIEDLREKGCKTLALDLTDEASMRNAVEEVEGAEGAVGVLVNNAGY